MTRRQYLRIGGVVVLMALLATSITGHLEPALDAVIGHKLQTSNDAYLEHSFNKAIVSFGVMSVWKAGLDIYSPTDMRTHQRMRQREGKSKDNKQTQ